MNSMFSTERLWGIPLFVWLVQVRSLRNSTRQNVAMRIGFGLSLLFGLGMGLWSGWSLWHTIGDWQMQGEIVLQRNLWLLCFSIWCGMSLVSVLSMLDMVRNDETLVLLTLPIVPAVRFRMLFGSFFISNLWFWSLSQMIVMACVLLPTLRWSGLIWFCLLQSGILVGVGMTLVLVLLVMRYIFPGGGRQVRIPLLLALAGLALSVLMFAIPLFNGLQSMLAWQRPEMGLLVCAIVLVMMWGPGAMFVGHLYEQVIVQEQSRSHTRRTFIFPGIRLLLGGLYRRRGIFWALMTRAVINQSRNWFFWLRLGLFWGLVLFFPNLQSALLPYMVLDIVLVAGYASLLTLAQILETGPGAISSEGNRLALSLVMPLSLSHILWSRLALFLLPLLLEVWVMVVIMGSMAGLVLREYILVGSIAVLIVTSTTALLIWGSAWDIDLKRRVESMEERILHEEGPFTPRKMFLFNVCLIFLAAMLVLIWRLPLWLSPIALSALCAVVLWGMWRFALWQLQRALRNG